MLLKRNYWIRLTCIILAMLAGAFFSSVSAQTFKSFNSGGILFNRDLTGWVAQTVNGLKIKPVFMGIGAGLNSNYGDAIPLFVDAKFFFPRSGESFIYADGGYSFLVRNDRKMENLQDYSRDGFYTDFGVGIQIPLRKKLNLFFTLGITHQPVTRQSGGIQLECVNCGGEMFTKDHRVGSLSARAGISF